METSTWPVWPRKFWLTVLVLTLPSWHLIRAVRRSANKDRTQHGLRTVEKTVHEKDVDANGQDVDREGQDVDEEGQDVDEEWQDMDEEGQDVDGEGQAFE